MKNGKNPTIGSKDIVQTRKCHRIYSFPTAVTLKIKPRSPKSNQFFDMSQLYIHANWKNPNTCSQDIVQTRKWDANVDPNRIHTNINVPLPVDGGGTKYSSFRKSSGSLTFFLYSAIAAMLGFMELSFSSQTVISYCISSLLISSNSSLGIVTSSSVSCPSIGVRAKWDNLKKQNKTISKYHWFNFVFLTVEVVSHSLLEK